MIRHILLDSSPLSYLCKPTSGTQVLPIVQWGTACLAAGHRLYVPEIIAYELSRELIRAGKTTSITRLDSLKASFRYLPITTELMTRAAVLWAQARNSGQPTGHPLKLDIDVILAAQAITLAVPASDIIVATENVGHISRFVNADIWSNIKP